MSATRAWAAVLSLVAVLGWQAPALAAKAGGAKPTIKMKLLGTTVAKEGKPFYYGALLTDGVRWAAYEPTAGVTRIINSITGGAVNRPDPVGCNGQLIAVGGGELLYACANPECPGELESCPIQPAELSENARFVVEDIVGGAQHPLAGESHLPSSNTGLEGGPGILEAIGQQWAMGAFGTHGGPAIFFVNWHTGAIEHEAPSANGAFYDDLDSAELLQSLCEPLTRPINEVSDAPLFAPTLYESPFAVIGPLGYEQVPLELRRCASSKRVLLSEGGPYANSVQLGDHVLSWIGSGTRGNYTRTGGAYVTRLTPRSRSWHGPLYKLVGIPGPKTLKNYNPPILQHTSGMVFVTVRAEGSKFAQIYYARLPWVSAGRKRTNRGQNGGTG